MDDLNLFAKNDDLGLVSIVKRSSGDIKMHRGLGK